MKVLRMVLLVTFSALAAQGAVGQQIVHAVSGTITAIHPKIGTIELNTDDGSSGQFRCADTEHLAVDFNKDVKADSTAADKFAADGARVIVYYFGNGTIRTAVAIHDLGKDSVTQLQGTVVKFNKHDKTLLVKSNAGTDETFHLDQKTVGDTPTGVAENLKFSFDKGNPVNVTASQANGTQTALLITPVM